MSITAMSGRLGAGAAVYPQLLFCGHLHRLRFFLYGGKPHGGRGNASLIYAA
jgi:hypothetical protein